MMKHKALTIGASVTCVVAAYLLGLLVIGPHLSRRHVPRVSLVQPSERTASIASAAPVKTGPLNLPNTAPPPTDAVTPSLPGESAHVQPAGDTPVSPASPASPSRNANPEMKDYRVQAGSFTDQQAADALAARLAAAGFTAAVRRVQSAGDVTFTVSTGVFTGRSRAQSAATLLRENGFQAALIPSD